MRIAVLCTLLLSGVLFAQTSGMTLDQAWSAAIGNNPRLKSQDSGIEAARTQVKVESDDRLPRLSLRGGYQYMSDITTLSLFGNSVDMGVNNRWDFSAQVQQPLFTGFRTRGMIEGAAADTLALQAGRQLTVDQIRLQVAVLFCSVQALDEQARALEKGIERADNQLHRLRSLLAVAQAIPLDTLEIANRRLELETSLSANRHQRSILLSQLEEWVGVRFEPKTTDTFEPMPVDPDGWVSEALVRRPEFASVRARRQRQAAMREAALSALYPQVFATAEYHYGIPGAETVDPEWNDYYTLGVQMQWNVWDWGQARERARIAELGGRQLSADEERLRAQVTREVRETAEQMNSLGDRIRLQAALTGQENLRRDTIQSRFDQGQSTALDLRDAESRSTEAECQLALLKAQWAQTRYQLLFVSGNLGGER